MDNLPILTVTRQDQEKFLRSETAPFQIEGKGNFSHGKKEFRLKELNELISRMKKIMRAANGVGLSANQIGLPYRLFVAQVPDRQGDLKFYAIFNPYLEKSRETEADEEGCLSVPGLYGTVARSSQVTLRGYDKTGRPVKIKAWGFLARVFQHEVDHLDGALFIDKAKNIQEAPASERLRARAEKIKSDRE